MIPDLLPLLLMTNTRTQQHDDYTLLFEPGVEGQMVR